METPEITAAQDHGIIFLGMCDRASYVGEGNTLPFKWNILGLRNVILTHIFPVMFNHLSIGFALQPGSLGKEYKLQVVNGSGEEVGTVTLNAEIVSLGEGDPLFEYDGPLPSIQPGGWTLYFAPLGEGQMPILQPGVYGIQLVTNDGPVAMGSVTFALVDPPPLTAERIAAIKSEPDTGKAVRVELSCKQCPSKCRSYAAIDRSPTSEQEGWTWYEELPPSFDCECGKTTIDLQHIRKNLHGLLGQRRRYGGQVNFVPMYETGAIETTRSNFAQLLFMRPREEALQSFIGKNPILLHQFPAERIYSKPKILTSFIADFGILTPQKELILIELEKTTTKLLLQDGGTAAPLTHALDQVRDWLALTDEHRLAVLDSLQIDRKEVSTIRGVVIAGRDSGYDPSNLRKLKGVDLGRIRFLTYDDLLFSLDALLRSMDDL